MISAQTARRAVWRPLWELPGRFELILSLARRELVARYKGSVLGIVWAVVTPVVTIAIFTFIFAGIFNTRFGAGGTPWDYALYLFCGLLPWTMFQETVQHSSTTIITHANLVKRVVFPLEILPVAQALSSLGNQMFGTLALVVATVIVRHELHVTILLMAWMYLTPIIYPESIVPESYRPFINLNPFTALVRSYRRIFLEGLAPDWSSLAYFAVIAAVLFVFGYWWFAKTRRNFADVI